MYSGQATVYQSDLHDFLNIANKLAVKGISEQVLKENKSCLNGRLRILDNPHSLIAMQSPKKETLSNETRRGRPR